MSRPKEIEVQEWIQSKLIEREIYPLTVFYTRKDCGTLGLSFYSNYDLDEILEVIDYKSLCDKSGYIVIPEYNTLIITNSSEVVSFIDKL